MLRTTVMALLLLPLVGWAQQGQLVINVTNIETPTGALFVTIYDNEEHWLKDDYFRNMELPVTSTDPVTVSIDDVPPGVYAVTVFQDVNGNGDIDTNFIGIPKEPYGFSGKVGKMGPPKFSKASFNLDGTALNIDIKLEN